MHAACNTLFRLLMTFSFLAVLYSTSSQAQSSPSVALNGGVDDVVLLPGWGGLGIGKDLTGYSAKYSGSVVGMTEATNGTWSLKSGLPLFTGGEVPVRAIIKSLDGGYIVGGEFTSVDGSEVSYLVRLKPNSDGSFSVDTNFNPKINGRVNALYLANGRAEINDGRPVVYVGGTFDKAGDMSRTGIAAIDEFTGALVEAWNPTITGANAEVFAIEEFASQIVIGGRFEGISGQARKNLAAVSPASGAPTGFQPDPDKSVLALEASAQNLYVGGLFENIAGRQLKYLAKFGTDFQLTTSFDAEISADTGANTVGAAGVYSIVLTESNILYFGGLFGSVKLILRENAAAINLESGQLADWNPSPSSTVRALCNFASRVSLGGDFKFLDELELSYIATVDTSLGDPLSNGGTAYNPELDKPVYALVCDGAWVIAGGDNELTNAEPLWRIMKMDRNWDIDSNFSLGVNDSPRGIESCGQNVVGYGPFTKVMTGRGTWEDRNGIFMLTPQSTNPSAVTFNVSSFNPVPTGGRISGVTCSRSGTMMTLYGDFTGIDGQPAQFIASYEWTPEGSWSRILSFTPSIPAAPVDVRYAPNGTTLYVLTSGGLAILNPLSGATTGNLILPEGWLGVKVKPLCDKFMIVAGSSSDPGNGNGNEDDDGMPPTVDPTTTVTMVMNVDPKLMTWTRWLADVNDPPSSSMSMNELEADCDDRILYGAWWMKPPGGRPIYGVSQFDLDTGVSLDLTSPLSDGRAADGTPAALPLTSIVTDGPVKALRFLNGRLTIGGDFHWVNGVFSRGIAVRDVSTHPVTAQPSSLSFPKTVSGTESEALATTVKNGASTGLPIRSIAITGDGAANFQVTSDNCGNRILGAGEGCPISVAFRPQAAGVFSATLTISFDGTPGSITVPLSGMGVVLGSELSTDRSAVMFTDVVLQDQAAQSAVETKTVIARNSGEANVQITSIAIAGANTAEFIVSADNCSNKTLTPGTTCDLGVAFGPMSEGTFTATLMIESTAMGAAKSVTLVGRATKRLKAPDTMITDTKVKGNKVTVRFDASQNGGTSMCQVDKGKWKPCKSPYQVKGLKPGKHTIKVYSVNGKGVADKSPAKVTFKVPKGKKGKK